ncbi:MAG: hypothetical protein KAX31_00130, partial [Thermoplasmata archaeon]|nr:hypothetical protein [Thermoplasmata archaeon]
MIRREDNGKSLRKVLVFFIIIVTIASIGAVGHFPNEKGSDIQLIDNLKHVEPCLTEPGLISIIPTSDKSSETYIMPPAYGQSFQNVNTSRCVLNELYACLSNASFLPSWLGAYDTLNGEYERDEAFFIQWHCNVDSILIPPGMGLTDPYDTGPNLFGPPWSDSLVRIFQSTPYGLSTPMYMFPVPSGPYAGTTIPIPMQWTDGTYLYEDPPVYYVADADEDFLLRTNDIRTLVETRRISETPVTIAINGTYDPVTTWGNISATLCAIGDLPTNELMVDFFLVENFGGIIEQWTTPAPPDWNLHTLNYTMNFIGRQWVGIAEPNSVGPWSFYNKTDTISYKNVSFWDLNNHSWNENQLWVLCSIRDMNTMNIIQTSAFNISATQPDLFITPQDVGLKNYGEVVNETVYGPTVNGETGPIYLNHGDIINCTLYIDLAGTEWLQLEEPADYTLNYTTGEIDTSTIEPYDDGWV